MKKTLFLTLALLIPVCGLAQDKKKPATWEEKAAARLKAPTDEQKQKILDAIPEKSTAEPKKERRILVFWRCEGFIHTSIPHGNFAIQEMGKKTGAYSVELADQYDVFTPESLKQFDAVLFNNTTNLKFPEEESKKALMDFMAAGKGVAGIHAASDNFKSWDEAATMIGGVFNGHPWGAGGEWAFKIDDPDHPLVAAFGGEGFWHTDEIYQYKPESYAGEDELRILVSLDMTKSKNISVLLKSKKGKAPEVTEEEARERQVPVSWIRTFNGGRVFYSNLGHREDTFWDPDVLQHYLDGIQYALGDLEADATPTAEMPSIQPNLAPPKE